MVGRVPEATGAGRADEFAELLLELKERSGLSYGALAKRLHMSTSTLHRYCSGAAVPNEYAPVERLARACRATPRELMELHRRWILADAVRGGRAESAAGAGAGAVAGAGAGSGSGAGEEAGAGTGTGTGSGSASDAAQGSGAASGSVPAQGSGAASGSVPASDPVPATDSASTASTDSPPQGPGPNPGRVPDPVVTDVPPTPTPAPPARRRRTALIAAVAVAAVLGAAALAAQGPFGGGNDDTGARGADSATSVTTGKARPPHPSATDSRTPSPSRGSGESGGTRKPSTSAAPPRITDPRAPDDGAGQGAADPADPAEGGNAVPLNVATRPYVYDNPCSQHFLVDSEPEQVGPPASEQDAPRWAAAYGAVSSGEQRVALTVQGTGRDTVVLEALHVRVVTKGAPLAWNDYAMGVGCGGGVDTKSFDVDLDNGSPAVNAKNGQRDFPYKVSESDPEVFYITAHASAHDVRWDLSLEWSSGSRRGTVHIDNAGTPFRTSAGAARPGYDYPLGGGEWIPREGG
ncbi:helix-turn-helix transcriptional regulator [Streptomyces sp. NPDC006638]|uniref:helix-turn-helix domain-containing protein n=1 Tax=Streptomyces sp. NPDC006638 TaxID=3157183 RepID=UPI0033A4AFAA